MTEMSHFVPHFLALGSSSSVPRFLVLDFSVPIHPRFPVTLVFPSCPGFPVLVFPRFSVLPAAIYSTFITVLHLAGELEISHPLIQILFLANIPGRGLTDTLYYHRYRSIASHESESLRYFLERWGYLVYRAFALGCFSSM